MHISELDTPVTVVDLDVMERNLRRAAEYMRAHGVTLWPHTKTHKCPEIARRQIELGAGGICVAKLGEAEVMADAGIEEIFIAYPLVGEVKLRRLMALCERAHIRVALDSEEVAREISRAASAAGHTVGVVVEADTGMRRCGLAVGPELVDLCRLVMDLPGLDFIGPMVYQGHLKGTAEERVRRIPDENARLEHLYETLTAAGITWRQVTGGSTPTLYHTHLLKGITEARPGTYVFNDRNTLGVEACTLEDTALHVLATVVSTAVPGQMIVDAGSKTLTSDRYGAGDGKGHGMLLEDPGVIISWMSEEHGMADLSGATRAWRIGDRVTIVPNHVCPLVNLHDELVLHRGGEVVGSWKVAGRGRVR